MIEVSEDFQGWPVKIKTLREILTEIGFKEKDGVFGIDISNDILDAYPRLLTDDGMGYGVNERYITELSVFKDNDGTKCVNIFAEKALPEEELDKLFGTNYAEKDDVIKLTPSNDDENLHI